MKFVVKINNSENDKYNENDSNVGTITVGKNGIKNTDEIRVQLFIDRKQILTLGEELLRFANEVKTGDSIVLNELDSTLFSSKSAKLVVNCVEKENIYEYFK